MTPKQQLRSIEKKMERLQKNNPDVDMKITSRYFHNVERYYNLSREHFYLEFKINHCNHCGKKL